MSSRQTTGRVVLSLAVLSLAVFSLAVLSRRSSPGVIRGSSGGIHASLTFVRQGHQQTLDLQHSAIP
jgi:hypothetical protein